MASASPGMTEVEREGCQEVLEMLHTDDLMCLVDTVTNKLIQTGSRKEAIRAIVLYSNSAEELLKRKKVFREIIFKYLAKKGMIVSPASEKHVLISRAREYWCKQLESVPTNQENPDEKNKPENEEQGKGQPDFHEQCHSLGDEFCQWFFNLLNSQNPLHGKPKGDWGPHHFFQDAILNFRYNTIEQSTEKYVGAELISFRLLSLVKDEYLFLNPNLNIGGMRCTATRHGLVVVAVAGTVHRGSSCLGVFEQVFGLIRCPFTANTWKIKVVTLNIVGQNALESGSQIERPAIKYTEEELQEFYGAEVVALVQPQTI